MLEYPKWLPVDGPGHPQHPGHVLVENEDQEAEALASGKGPAALNPPPDAGQKSLDEMNRDELIAVLVAEGIPDDMSDDEIRNAIRHGRESKAEKARQQQEDAEHDREAREAGGDHGDGLQTTTAPKASAKAPTDSAGDAISPDPADEANKGGDTDTRTAPAAKSASETDGRPDDAKAKIAADKPAGNVTEVAETPKDKKTAAKS
jgi:hypothetical protein